MFNKSLEHFGKESSTLHVQRCGHYWSVSCSASLLWRSLTVMPVSSYCRYLLSILQMDCDLYTHCINILERINIHAVSLTADNSESGTQMGLGAQPGLGPQTSWSLPSFHAIYKIFCSFFKIPRDGYPPHWTYLSVKYFRGDATRS